MGTTPLERMEVEKETATVMIAFAEIGPYHAARIDALSIALKELGASLVAVQFEQKSRTYSWDATNPAFASVHTLSRGGERKFSDFVAVWNWGRLVWRLRPKAAFLPSYWPLRNCLVLLLAKCFGCTCIMMNESWAGTERATGLSKKIKRSLVGLFDGGLVGGRRHIEFFRNMGIPANRLSVGYDVVDNDFFERSVDVLRTASRTASLPERYFLNIGRMVEKKNLMALIKAYTELVRSEQAHGYSLVLVGDGPDRDELVAAAFASGISVNIVHSTGSFVAKGSGIYFYPFTQVRDLPRFYAFADAFILPSIAEEWGLVVNEALASGLPVVVSENAGCVDEIVFDRVNGLTCDPQQPRELLGCLSELAGDSQLRARMALAGREIIRGYGPGRFSAGAVKLLEQTGFFA